MSFPRYPEYKDSEVEWLGEVPAHWSVAPFKRHIIRNDGGVWGEDPVGENDTIVLRSTEQTVEGRWAITDPATRKLTSGEKESARLRAGDLLVTKSSGSASHIGKTTLVTEEIAAMQCCFSNFMQRLRTASGFMPTLAWYLMNSPVARLQFDLLSNSTTGLANLNGSILGQMMIAVPPLHEQLAIGTFLDHETAKIDALIAEQERLIELLKEKRQAVISHAVTKGLDPDVPMKDSGVEWLGVVPAHWPVMALKRLVSPRSSISYGIVQPGAHVDDGVPFVQTTNMTSGRFDLVDLQRTSNDIASQYPRSRLSGGEVILGIRATIGSAIVVPKELAGANLSRGVARIECCDDLLAEFLTVYLAGTAAATYWQLAKQGSTFNEVSIETVRHLRVPLPPISEQAEICAYLRREAQVFDVLACESREAINLLKERRAVLISAAVTGQIDVRYRAETAIRGIHHAGMPA